MGNRNATATTPGVVALENRLNQLRRQHGDVPREDVAQVLGEIAIAHEKAGDQRGALCWHQQSLEMKKRVFGETTAHHNVALSLHNVGLCHKNLRELATALSYFEQSLAMFARLYPERPHVHMGIVNDNTAFTQDAMGDMLSARSSFERSLAVYTATLGEGGAPHEFIANTLNNIGLASLKLGDAEQAHGCFVKALDMRMKLCGDKPDHMLALFLNNLGSACLLAGDHESALKAYRQAETFYLALYGSRPNHDFANNINNIGRTIYLLGDSPQAVTLLSRAELQFRAVHGSRPNDDYASCLTNLGLALQDAAEPMHALEQFERALAMWQQLSGDQIESLGVAKAINNVGSARQCMGEFAAAEECYRKSLDIKERLGAPVLAAVSLANIATIYVYLLPDAAKAEECLQRALNVYRQQQDPESQRMIANLLKMRGRLLLETSSPAAAVECLQESLAIYTSLHGEKAHPDVAFVNYELARAHCAAGAHSLARTCLQISLPMAEAELGGQHPDVGTLLYAIAFVEQALGNTEAASAASLRATDITQHLSADPKAAALHQHRKNTALSYAPMAP